MENVQHRKVLASKVDSRSEQYQTFFWVDRDTCRYRSPVIGSTQCSISLYHWRRCTMLQLIAILSQATQNVTTVHLTVTSVTHCFNWLTPLSRAAQNVKTVNTSGLPWPKELTATLFYYHDNHWYCNKRVTDTDSSTEAEKVAVQTLPLSPSCFSDLSDFDQD